MVVIAWRKLLIAGIAGFTCGKGYVWLRKYPDTVKPILYCTAISGTSGVLIGLGVSAYRDLPSHVYALSAGANFAVVSAAFLGVRHLILTPLADREIVESVSTIDLSKEISYSSFPYSPSQAEYVSSAASGGIAGTLVTLISKPGLRSVVLSGFVGVVLALIGQLSYDQFERWRKRKAIEIHYPELKTESNWNFATFESKFMSFWHQRSRGLQIDSDVALATETIKDEQKKILHLDQLLREKGVNPVTIDNVKGKRPMTGTSEIDHDLSVNIIKSRDV